MQRRAAPSTDLRGRPALRDTSSTKFFLKLGCDHRLASAVIGARGQKIKDMMNRSQTFIKLSKKGNWFPDTQCQLLLVGGPTIQSLLQVLDRVMFELDHTISSLGEHTADVRVVVPSSAVPRIIGHGEQGLTDIRALGCRVVVDGRQYHIDEMITEQFITLTGTVQSLAQSITRINEVVQVDFLQPWYLKWGSHWILSYADELMNRADKGQGQGGSGRNAVGGGPITPAIRRPEDVQAIVELGGRFNGAPQTRVTLQTEMAVEVTLEPAHAEIVSCGVEQIGLRNIERNSGAQLSFAPEENGVCPLTITGLPFSIYCAHLLLMSRIVRHIEASSGASPADNVPTPQNAASAVSPSYAPSPGAHVSPSGSGGYVQSPAHVSPTGSAPGSHRSGGVHGSPAAQG